MRSGPGAGTGQAPGKAGDNPVLPVAGPLAVLRRYGEPADDQPEAAQQVPVGRGAGQEADVVEDDHQNAEAEKREHEDRHPQWAVAVLRWQGSCIAAARGRQVRSPAGVGSRRHPPRGLFRTSGHV